MELITKTEKNSKVWFPGQEERVNEEITKQPAGPPATPKYYQLEVWDPLGSWLRACLTLSFLPLAVCVYASLRV